MRQLPSYAAIVLACVAIAMSVVSYRNGSKIETESEIQRIEQELNKRIDWERDARIGADSLRNDYMMKMLADIESIQKTQAENADKN